MTAGDAGFLAGCMVAGWLAGVLIAKACIRRWETKR